jgi:Spy/CpxP family protein refolding chaperone
MNYFTKNRILIWIVIAAFAINISAIVTILYHTNKGKCRMERDGFHNRPHEFFKNELNLSPEQDKQFKELFTASREEARPVVMKIREQRQGLMKVLFEKNVDSLKLKLISDSILQSQALLMQHTIKHYFDLKKILKDEQQEKLNMLYQDLFGCERMQMGKKCEPGCRKGDGSGGGNGNRHGHGHGKGDGSGGGNRDGKGQSCESNEGLNLF